jgi:hypothetical protein
MIYDHYHDKWRNPPYTLPNPPIYIPNLPTPNPGALTKEEIEEFRKLLERAREYDKQHNHPDCELEEKRRKVKELAKSLGVEINFV